MTALQSAITETEMAPSLPHIPGEYACALIDYIQTRVEAYTELRILAEKSDAPNIARCHRAASNALVQLSIAIGHASRLPKSDHATECS